jgi:hypothetical protein
MHDQENQEAFFPIHNVFGAQTGIEASNSPFLFQANYERSTENGSRFTRSSVTSFGRNVVKDWASVMPKSANGNYLVQDVAAWLWQRFVADGLKNYGALERAYLYALLATGLDLARAVNATDVDHVYTVTELTTNSALVTSVNALGSGVVDLGSTNATTRAEANRRVGQAINFIIATPYMFAQEGR